MNVIIDRFEGDYAVVVLEDGTTANLAKILLPPDVKEGDVIEIRKNEEETLAKKRKIQKLMADLWED